MSNDHSCRNGRPQGEALQPTAIAGRNLATHESNHEIDDGDDDGHDDDGDADDDDDGDDDNDDDDEEDDDDDDDEDADDADADADDDGGGDDGDGGDDDDAVFFAAKVSVRRENALRWPQHKRLVVGPQKVKTLYANPRYVIEGRA